MYHQSTGWPAATRVSLSQTSLKELAWWLSPGIQAFNGQPLKMPLFDVTISTDASQMGSGATWPGTTTGGRWLPIEAREHINFQELKTAHLALQTFFRTYAPTPKHVLLLMDNSKAVEYLNKRGGQSHTASQQKLWSYGKWSWKQAVGSLPTTLQIRHLGNSTTTPSGL